MSSRRPAARAIALYLPQYYTIPENDEWWGRGFTEWTNAAKAKPMFRGHYQPHIPADFGYYDLRVPETRIAQARMAGDYGIEAFCYYYYWFAGRRLLERPFAEVLESGKPDFPFCLCWANHSWTGVWIGCPGRMLIEQTYPGESDFRAHFNMLLQAFRDGRYLKVDGKPLLLVFDPMDIPGVKNVTDLWRSMAMSAGLRGLHLVGMPSEDGWNPQQYGFDGATPKRVFPQYVPWRRPVRGLMHALEKRVRGVMVYWYDDFVSGLVKQNKMGVYPCVLPNWDNTPRSGKGGFVIHGSTPELFRVLVKKAIESVKDFPQEQQLIFIKSWNEWAEGNHLEPDLRFGRAYLQVVKEEILG